MRSKGWVVASLCLLAVLLAAIVPTAADPTHAILDSVAAPPGIPAFVGYPSGNVLTVPPESLLVDRTPARAPPLA